MQRPRDQQGPWSEGKVLVGADKYSSGEGVWPRKLERGTGAVPPRAEVLGLDSVGNGSQGRPCHEHIRT